MSMKNLRKWYRDKYYGPNCGYNHRKYMYITTKACWFTSTHQKLFREESSINSEKVVTALVSTFLYTLNSRISGFLVKLKHSFMFINIEHKYINNGY